ncbi:type II toxin-antitoxin system YafQ family toxin [Lacimicrobium alkaliphilum]|uniref:Addiction module toxin RelE n=1 Tax=Lacimicrobium alkaliphilum TaxID=1526571 RepID=A0ABQ1RFK3_9ALTE|nr:type II toxin-antitoxin system YafQ family toxin [Lacimicrobium alkaliphilum]GGD66703.1 addiction module toxin RelE [Lacimicrobium alkaliphilum]
MYRLEYSSQFKKDFKKVIKMPISDVLEVGNVIKTLQRGEALHTRYKDHPLTGNWHEFRDCHIKPDLVLIYRIDQNRLQLARIGSHSDLF